MHLNLRSLKNKILEVNVLLSETIPSIFCATEHWAKEEELERMALDGYNLVGKSCRMDQRGGGTAIYATKGLEISAVTSLPSQTEKQIEYCCCKFVMNKKLFIIICIYRSPSGDIECFIEKLIVILDQLCTSSKYIIVCGDFNINFSVNSNESNNIKQLLSSYSLTSHVTGITRPNFQTFGTQVDNIFSNITGNLINCSILESEISDHFSQILDIKILTHDKPTYIRKRFYTDSNVANFKTALISETWDEVYRSQNVNTKYKNFYNILFYHFDVSFPLTISKVKNNQNGWISNELKKYSAYIRDLYTLYLQTKCNNVLIKYKQEKKAYKEYLSEYKKTINDSKIISSNNRSKTVWSILNNMTNRKTTDKNITLSGVDNITISNPEEVAKKFISHFTLTSNNDNIYYHSIGDNINSIFLQPVTRNEVFNVITQLPTKYSCGIDGIPPHILKKIAEYICDPLTDMINECFTSGTFPDDLKLAKVIPIYKKGSKLDINNYRPVSVLPSPSKVFERIIYNRLVLFLNHNNILTKQQYGFRQGMSTELAIFNTVTYITDNIDKRKSVAGLYFDLSKAFDTIDHHLLLSKLESYGIRGVCLSLIKSYLSGRQQTVCINYDGSQHYSELNRITQGVPQGSILGPILFLLYVNDLSNKLNIETVYQFADDTSVILANQNLQDLSIDLTNVSERMANWCNENVLKLNTTKTGLIVFGNPRNQITNESLYVRLLTKSVENLNSIKFLGVFIDTCLSWDVHIQKLNTKLSSICGVIRCLRDQVTLDSLRIYYFSCVQSIILYGIIFWGSSPNAKKIFITQKRIIRCMLKVCPRTSCKPFFAELGCLTVPSLYFLSLVKFVKKNLHLFPTNREFYSYDMSVSTRQGNEIRIPNHTSTFFEKGPYYSAIKAYKSLPSDIKEISDSNRFANSVIEYLKIKCYYTFGCWR